MLTSSSWTDVVVCRGYYCAYWKSQFCEVSDTNLLLMVPRAQKWCDFKGKRGNMRPKKTRSPTVSDNSFFNEQGRSIGLGLRIGPHDVICEHQYRWKWGMTCCIVHSTVWIQQLSKHVLPPRTLAIWCRTAVVSSSLSIFPFSIILLYSLSWSSIIRFPICICTIRTTDLT